MEPSAESRACLPRLPHKPSDARLFGSANERMIDMDRQTPILDALFSITQDNKARFCMPGHKGDPGYFGGELLRLDITELPGADNLLNPTGAIKASQDLHAKYIGAASVHYTTGGSTAGNLAMLSLFRGRKVIFARGIHQSAANAISMMDITPVYLPAPAVDYPSTAAADDVAAALHTHKDAAAVYIVYPNYFGLCCNIERIAEQAHQAGLPLLVDAAHAAHFAFSPLLPRSPADSGADLWTESTHKMLPAMNQCACLCVGTGASIKSTAAARALTMFQSTSPSYLLLGSMDYAHAFMRDKGENELFRVISLAERFRQMIDALPGLYCPAIDQLGMIDADPLKIIIDVSGTGHTGMAVKSALAGAGIHVEAADMKSILLLLTPGDTAPQLDALHIALRRIEKTRAKRIYFSPYSLPEATKYSPNSRLWGNIEKRKIERAVGMVSAATVGVYPPAQAVVHRGQVISYEIAGYLLEARRQGFEVFGLERESIYVFKEKI